MALCGQSTTLLLLLLATALLASVNHAQHYSLEWKPGGKRDLEAMRPMLEELEPPNSAFDCDGAECAFARVPSSELIRDLVNYLSQRNYQRKGALK